MNLNLDRAPGLTDQVANRLSEAIANGDLAPGDRLVEIELASRLGVSRAPLREALRELAATGLVVHRNGKGAFVAKPTLDEVAEMNIFRGVLEGMAARIVAAERKPQTLDRLDMLWTELEAVANSGDKTSFIKLHWSLHRVLCEEAGNRFLLQAWDGVSRLLRLYFNMALLSHEMKATLRNNRAYLHALRHCTPDYAEILVRSQIIGSAFKLLDRPVPAPVSKYVTVYVAEDGSVQPVPGGTSAD